MKTPAPDDLTGKFYQRFKGRHNINSTIIFQKIEEKITLSNSSLPRASLTLIPKLENDSTRKENYKPIYLKSISTKLLNKLNPVIYKKNNTAQWNNHLL